jgi:hypothetical protein
VLLRVDNGRQDQPVHRRRGEKHRVQAVGVLPRHDPAIPAREGQAPESRLDHMPDPSRAGAPLQCPLE